MSELLDKITDDINIARALRKVYANGGAGGVDKVTVDELEDYMKAHWKEIRNQIRSRQYRPQPVYSELRYQSPMAEYASWGFLQLSIELSSKR